MSDEEAQAKEHRGKPVKTWLFAAALFLFGVRMLSR